MLNKKESDNATRAIIKKEMAKPQLAKSVRQDLSVTLAKSAHALSCELPELRVQVRGQLDQLMTKINALVANRPPAARQTRV